MVRKTLNATSLPPTGALEVVDVLEEDSVQPVLRGEGSSQRKRRMTKAQREAAATPAKESLKLVPDATTAADESLPSSPTVASEDHFTSNVAEAAEDFRGKWKVRQQPTASTSVAQTHSVEVMLENASFFNVMETLERPSGPDALWEKVHQFISHVGSGRIRRVSSPHCKNSGLDLIIADIPENLPVPSISLPPTIPPWNLRPDRYVESIFEFGDGYLHDDAPILLFHSDDRALCSEVEEAAEQYSFRLCKDWWGINDIPLASPKSPSSMLQFSIRENRELSDVGLHVEHIDTFFNLTTAKSQLMRGNLPWHGAREMDPLFMQVLIECFSKPGDIVLDWNASTDASIRACQATGRHIIAFEDDEDIFTAVLQPLLSKPSPPRDTLKKFAKPLLNQRLTKKPKRNRISSLHPSPPQPLTLPYYAEDMAVIYASIPSPPPSTSQRTLNLDVEQFMDVEALEGDFSEGYSI